MIASANSSCQSSRVASGTTIGYGAIINANAKIGITVLLTLAL